MPYAPAANSAGSDPARTRHTNRMRPTTSPSHCSANCEQSARSARATNPSRSRARAARRVSPSLLATPGWPTATRTRGPPAYVVGPPGLAARRRPPTATSAADWGASLELSTQGGVFSNDFLISLALDRRLRHRGDLADRFRILQVCVDRRDDDPRLDGDEIDAHQRNTNPGIDHDPLVEHAIEDIDETSTACCTFNRHRTLLISTQPCGAASMSRAGARAPAPASSIPRFPLRAPACPVTGDDRTSTSRARSVRPCRSSR